MSVAFQALLLKAPQVHFILWPGETHSRVGTFRVSFDSIYVGNGQKVRGGHFFIRLPLVQNGTKLWQAPPPTSPAHERESLVHSAN